MQIGKEEAIHIAISTITIALAFSLQNLAEFPSMLIAVGLGFILHEMMHKVVAINYGARAEFRAWTWGLGLAILMALVSGGRFIFAAPGAVYIFGKALTKEQNGIVSLAGPLTNFVLALVFLSVPLGMIGAYGAAINLWLGIFNMIPIPPLDGSKVFAWNPAVWAGVFVLFLLIFFHPLALSLF